MKTRKATFFIFYSILAVALVGTSFSHLWRTKKKRDALHLQVSETPGPADFSPSIN